MLWGKPFVSVVVSEPDRMWEPLELLEFSRAFQRPVGPGFTYSDTGYILLGLMLEHVTGRQFHELLHEKIFGPVGMTRSWMPWRSAPSTGGWAIAPFTLGKVEASHFRSVSCDWAGGGIASTLGDLTLFSRALFGAGMVDGTFVGGQLLSGESLARLAAVRNRFRAGIRYGTGMMQLRFEEFFFLLRGMPRPVGHIGILGTHLFYDAVHDAHIVMNFGGTTEMVPSFRTLIQIEQELKKVAASA